MQVLNPNNIKIYNLSSGKSLPEWLTDRKKRSLQKNDVEIQRRIELIQDFEMPICSTSVQASPDGQYLFVAGVYKPRVRCYDVSQLSMKFERCLDSEIVKFHILSEDYSKIVFLQADRYVEFHSQHGRYYRTRIPKYGRDLAYHQPSCDMYFVGASNEIYRMNLELGRFMSSLKTKSTELLCCQFNPVHQLFVCGSSEGHIECWDPRMRNCVGRLDCALNSFMQETELEGIPAVTSVKYRDGLTLGVGTSTGQVLLYDLRSDKPILMKDHNFGLPIKSIEFHDSQNLVLSCDTRILKLWHRDSGKAYTSIETGTALNDLCLLKDTGMLFMANEAPKVQAYYIPSIGPAPKWCSFLDSLTEELEENPAPTVYDDYRFVTRTELDSLGLSHLIGSSLLRAYMHGYFLDVRLYRKAKAIADPFAYEDYRKNKIREKIDEERSNRVKLQKLPKVNKNLAEKLIEQNNMELSKKKKNKKMPNLMQDDRFSQLFENPHFQVDMESEEYRLLNPLVSKLDRDRQKKQEKLLQQQADDQEAEEEEGRPSDDGDSGDDSSDDDHTWTKEVKEQHRQLKQEDYERRQQERQDRLSGQDCSKQDHRGQDRSNQARSQPAFYEISAVSTEPKEKKLSKRSLGERIQASQDSGVIKQSGASIGNMEMTFDVKKSASERRHRREAEKHHSERRKIRRSAGDIMKDHKEKPKFWMGKRVT